MKKFSTKILIITVLFAASSFSNDSLSELGRFEWTELSKSYDVYLNAGSFIGASSGKLIIAGGINENFDYSDTVTVLPLDQNDKEIKSNIKLPFPLAFGAYVVSQQGLICIGGRNANQISDKVFVLSWNELSNEVEINYLPSLPKPLTYSTATLIGNHLYVAGGTFGIEPLVPENNFWRIDIRADSNWEKLNDFPGEARIAPIAAAQSEGMVYCFYLLGGMNLDDEKFKPVSDGYFYNPDTRVWSHIDSNSPEILTSVNKSSAASGVNNLLFFPLRINDKNILRNKFAIELEKQEKSRKILSFNTITYQWSYPDMMPESINAAKVFERDRHSIRVLADNGIVYNLTFAVTKRFGFINYAVIGVYMSSMVFMGIYFSKRENSTDDFFKAGGRIPWWAAGLSIFGTQLSAITFMAIPAKTYATDWRYIAQHIFIFAATPLLVWIYLPFYRRLHLTTAYEYFEKRFNVATRIFGSIMYILLQLGRIGIILLLPSIALAVMTGIDVRLLLLIIGVLSIVYTVMGGIEAVIWTDVVQAVVLMGGAILCLVIIALRVTGGFGGIFEIAHSSNKLYAFDFSPSLNTQTFWMVGIATIGARIISGVDQTQVQRFLATKNEKEAAKSIWFSAIVGLPAALLFFAIGTAIFSFYQYNPERMSPALDNQDGVLPWFILAELPIGLSGILVSGLFAAAMSSLDSSMNSVATAVTTDFYQRFRKGVSDESSLKFAKIVTVIIGIAGTGFAIMMATWEIKSLWDQLSIYMGLATGGLGGILLLGIFSTRVSGTAALIGLAASTVIQYYIRGYTGVYFMLYVITGITSAVVIGYCASWIFPADKKKLHGLTFYTIRDIKE